ncbi:hypothetical protein P7C71_g4811, partial [Lecanoromycetidae sp. Uapishka_2]
MAATRLRKTFHYPADNSDEDDAPREMDEEEQEKLIKNLEKEDDERNEQWKRIFLAIPAIATASYIPTLIMSRVVQAKLLSLLSITSLIATAYILLFVPNTRPMPAKVAKPSHQFQTELGPVKQYVVILNGGLSFLITLNAIAFKDKKGVHEGFWMLLLLPVGKSRTPQRFFQADPLVVSYSIILLARRLMLSVDVNELEDLRYRYKGA